MIYRLLFISLILQFSVGYTNIFACTNLIITKGASSDNSAMITYNADSHIRYGAIAYYPAADHQPGDRGTVYHYENGKLMGEIPEIAHTYSVVQFMNENQFVSEIQVADKQATELFRQDPASAGEYLTSYSVFSGNKLVSDWKAFYQYLFMKYMDGNVKNTDGRKLLENGNGKNIPKGPTQPGYGKDWERIMIQGTGDRLVVPKGEK
jgi:hypothetical protein